MVKGYIYTDFNTTCVVGGSLSEPHVLFTGLRFRKISIIIKYPVYTNLRLHVTDSL